MSKDSIADYDTDPTANTDVGGVDIRGTAPVSNMNNALQTMMSHLKSDVFDIRAAVTNLEDLTNATKFTSLALAQAHTPVTAPLHIATLGYGSAGDMGGALYKKVNAEPTASGGKFSITLSDGSTIVWYQISETVKTPQMFGALGDGSTDDTTAINQALEDGNCKVHFPFATYMHRTPLRVYSNTVITGDRAVIKADPQDYATGGSYYDNSGTFYGFLNGEHNNATYATVYNGDGDIDISGIVYDGADCVTDTVTNNPIGFGHGNNIKIHDCEFKNNYKSHFLEINALQNVKIFRNNFINLVHDGATNREAINVDYAYSTGANFGGFGSYDDTPCDDIDIYDNYFEDCQVCVGSHSTPYVEQTRIRVRNNVAKDMDSRFCRPRGWKYFSINDNYVDGTQDECIFADNAQYGRIFNNHGYNLCQDAGSSLAIYVSGGKEIKCFDNFVDGGSGVADTYRVQDSGDETATRHSVNTYGVVTGSSDLIQNSGTLTEINGKTLLFSGNANSGALNLDDEMTRYEKLMVVSGTTGDGSLVVDISIGWAEQGFRTGDTLNFRSDGGSVKLDITDADTLTIDSASDNVRYIFGVNRIATIAD